MSFPSSASALSKRAPSGCPGSCMKRRSALERSAGRGRRICSRSSAFLSPVKNAMLSLYTVREAGEYNLVIGTDYGHTDSSSDLDAINVFRRRDDLSPAVKEKILSDNARALYAL